MRAGRLIGRDLELELLERQLSGATSAGPRVVLLSGEAGIGKTSLVEHFARSVRHPEPRANVARGFSVPLGGAALPFAPMLGVLRSLEELHGTETIAQWAGGGRRALAALLPELLEGSEQPDHTEGLQLQMFEAVARVLRRSSDVRPLVVTIDDVHWADSSSRALLQFLGRTLTGASVLLVLTFRTSEAAGDHELASFVADLSRLPGASRLPLPRLDRASVGEMLSRMLGEPVPASRVDEVHQRSQGVPFYVEELGATGRATGGALPDVLRETLRIRAGSLSTEVRSTVALAAVAGIRVHHDLLMEAVEDPALAERHLRTTIDAGLLLVEGDEYVFAHALYAEALIAELLPGERARMHAAMAVAIERRPDLVTGSADHAIAGHWSASGDVRRAFVAAVRATRSSSVAHAESLVMYERILEAWEDVEGPESAAGPLPVVLTDAARCARDAGDFDRAVTWVSSALDHTPRVDVTGRVDRLLLRALLLIDSLRDGARDDLDRAEELLDHVTDPRTRALLLGRAATLRLNIGAAPLPTVREAVTAVEGLGDPGAEAEARITLGTALVAACREDEGVTELRRALELPGLGAHAQLRGLLNLSDALHLRGDYEEAVDAALAGLAASTEHGMERSFGTYLAGNAAESMLATGAWPRAADLLAEAVSLDPPSSHRTHLELLLAWLHTLRGEKTAAEEILRDHRHLARDGHQAPQYAVQLMRVDGENAVLLGDPERAWTHLLYYAEAHDRFDALRSWPLLAVGACAAATLDAVAPQGRRKVVRGLVAATPAPRCAATWSALVEAELANGRDGWEELVALLVRTSPPVHLVPYSQLRLAEHLSVARERSALRHLLDDAEQRARTIGARLLLERLTALGQRAGVAPTADPVGTSTPLAALTAREIEVLRLVAQGMSNKAVGERLFISAKTASVHVSNILAKLGAGGRAEAAAIGAQHGLLADDAVDADGLRAW